MTHIETRQGKIRQRRSPKNGERGFTLVEMLVVITIIALIMSLVG
ncbi:MAG: prepilin-type N-terminal cleavage/methylation domain-containing protein, partial [Pseudolabrys sp.]